MSQWARENPELMEEIAALPPSQQNEAMRNAIPHPAHLVDWYEPWELEELWRGKDEQ